MTDFLSFFDFTYIFLFITEHQSRFSRDRFHGLLQHVLFGSYGDDADFGSERCRRSGDLCIIQSSSRSGMSPVYMHICL